MTVAYPTAKRQAWLHDPTGALADLPLDNPDAGWLCTELDLGFPATRDVVSNKPDQHGTDDRTRYFGARVVTIWVTAFLGGSTAMDDIPGMFTAYMDPGKRPELHVIESSPTAQELVLVLRGSAYTGPLLYPMRIDMQLGFIAPDPALYGATVQSATAWAGSTIQGRVYPKAYPWTYPPGSQSAVTGIILSHGDLPVQPLLEVFGPATGAQIGFDNGQYLVPFTSGSLINAGDYVTVDTKAKSAIRNSDGASVLNWIDWSRVIWPVLAPNVSHVMSMTAISPTGTTQVQATWQDGYLA
jgi:hypothetical protein